MQRMKLYTSGVKLTRLGSLHDRVIRQYLTKETELEAKKHEFSMLVALTNPSFDSDSKRDGWVKTLQKSWNSFLGKLFNVDVPETTSEEEALKEYYDRVVSKMNLAIRKDKRGGLTLEGLEPSKVSKM